MERLAFHLCSGGNRSSCSAVDYSIEVRADGETESLRELNMTITDNVMLTHQKQGVNDRIYHSHGAAHNISRGELESTDDYRRK